MKQLKQDPNIVIVPADKGNATVVMNTDEYKEKISTHLGDSNTYQELQNNPLKKVQSKLNSLLTTLKDKKAIEYNQYLHLRSNQLTVPRIYGLIKIHRENNPIRPITSFCGLFLFLFYTYNTAQFLSKILTPLTELSETKLKNTLDIKQQLENIQIPANHVLVSFDVKALFTSIPTNLATECVDKLLTENTNLLTQLTSLNKNDILRLLEICIQSTIFQWNNKIYQQCHGTPMGSPISVALAELTMQSIEQEALTTSPDQIVLWRRYLDDIIAIIPENSTNRLLLHLNSINPHIKFTVEEDRDRKLPFLDLLITRKNDNSLYYAVHRKNTHTGNYLNFRSNHPMHHKRAVIKSLSDRAKQLCSEDSLGPELNTIGEDLAVNGYPRSFIESVMNNNKK